MRFGFHISIAGGFSKVIAKALKKKCRTIQFFSRNPRGWSYKDLDHYEVRAFKQSLKKTDIHPVFVHMPYLANLASCNDDLYKKSIDVLCSDLERAQVLGAPYLIMHIGHRGDKTEEEAIARITQAIDRAFNIARCSTRLLLENTAGQGTEIGYNFSQLKKIIASVKQRHRLGVCLDIAHAFEAGYDLATEKGLGDSLHEFEKLIGLEKLCLLHLNDSKTKLGSRSDRHWHIGQGFIGLEGFRRIVNHPRLRDLPGIMETPRKSDVEDLNNMRVILNLVNA